MATFTQSGTIVSQPASMTSKSNPNMQSYSNIYSDDSFWSIPLPFNFQFYNNLISTWNVGSNSYITKNGQSTYQITASSDVGIYVIAKDNSSDYVGLLNSSDGNSFTIHFEGNAQYSDGTHDLWWDATFFKDGVVQIVLDPINITIPPNDGTTLSCLSNGIDDSTVCGFIPVAGQSYVFIPNLDFSGYTVTEGVSYVYTPAVNDYIPNVPTNLSSNVVGTSITFNGTVNDQDGGYAYLSVEYSTDQTFATKTTVTSTSTSVGTNASITVNSLSPTTTYYWRARTYDGTNYSPYSSVMSSTTGTPLPPSLSNFSPATQSRYNAGTSVTLGATVTSPNGLSSTLTFQYSTDSNFITGVTTLTSPLTASGNTALASLSSSLVKGVYYWRVKATDTANTQSAWSSIFVFYINGTVTENLSPDTIISQTNTTGTISNVQDDPNSPDANSLTATTSGTANNMRLSFPTPSKSLSGTQTFNVWASATNTNGTVTSTISVYENGISKASGAAISVSTSGQMLTFTWNASVLSDPTGLNVEIYISNTGYSGSGNKKTNVSIGAVQWVASETDNPASVADPNPTDTTPPANVTNLQASKTSTSVTLTWTNPTDSDFSGTKIYRDSVYIGDGGTSGTYTDNNRNPNTTYSYKVTSIDTFTNESTGTTLSVTTLADTTPPAIPTGLTATGGNNNVVLSWNANTEPDLASYNLYKSTDGVNFSSYALGLTGTTHTDNNTTNGNTYYYKLTAVDIYNNESQKSSSVSATPHVVLAPSVPTNLFPFNGSAWTKLHFEADVTDLDSTNLTFYVDYSSTSSTLSSGVTTISSPVTLPSVGSTARGSITSATAVTENTVYYWRAYAKDESGNQSSYSPIFSFTIKNASGDNMVADGTPFMQQGDNYNFVRAIDVSSLQGTIDWVAVKNSGVDYALLRCYGSDHSGNGDSLFETYVANAKSAGVKTGGYFFLNIIYPYNLNDAHTEADKFIAKLQSGYGTGQYGDFMPFVDLEDNTGHVTAGQTNLNCTVEQFLQWVNEFRNYFESQTGRKLGAYIPDYFVRNQMNNFNHNDATDSPVAGTSGNIIKDMCLWASGFTSYPRYMGGVMPSFGGWKKWTAFQHGDTNLTPPPNWTLSGITGTVDLDWIIPQTEYILPPNPVTGLVGTDDGTNIILTWNQSSEVDVNKWDIYVDGTKVGTSTTDGSYTIISPTADVSHTIEVRPIDDFGDDPITSANTISYTLVQNTNPPYITSLTVSRYKISPIFGDNTSLVHFVFDSNINTYLVNINGVSYDTGITIASGGAQKVSQVSGNTVGTLSTNTVQSLTVVASGNQISVTIDNTEIPSGAEGSYRINIYGKSDVNGNWTPYNS